MWANTNFCRNIPRCAKCPVNQIKFYCSRKQKDYELQCVNRKDITYYTVPTASEGTVPNITKTKAAQLLSTHILSKQASLVPVKVS